MVIASFHSHRPLVMPDKAMKCRYTILTVCLFLMQVPVSQQASYAGEPASTGTVYTVYVVPQFEQRKLYAVWSPIVEDLKRRTGLNFKLITTLNVDDFHKAHAWGEFDFVYVSSYTLTRFHDTQGYIPLVADAAPISGIVVVRKDSPIKSVADLDGKIVAFPSPYSIAASLLVRSDFDQIHHVQITPLNASTHSSVYLHVAKGLAAAGGGANKTLQEQSEPIREQLRVIYTTRSFPSHPIAAHPRVPREVRDKVRDAILAMAGTREGQEMLAKVPMTRPIPVTYADYSIMQGWNLDKYWPALPEQH